jgi:hypothetical protein
MLVSGVIVLRGLLSNKLFSQREDAITRDAYPKTVTALKTVIIYPDCRFQRPKCRPIVL